MIRPLSLTARLTISFALVTSVVLLGLGWSVTIAVKQHFVIQDSEALGGKLTLAQRVITSVSSAEQLAGLRYQLQRTFDGHSDLMVQALGPDGAVLFATPEATFPARYLARSEDTNVVALFQWTASERQFRGLTAAIPTQIPGYPPVVIGLALDIGRNALFISRFEKTLVLFIVGVAVISGPLGWFAARRGLAPLRLLRERAAAVTASGLHQRLPVDSVPIELTDLAITLNEMLGRLEDAFGRLSDFSSDIAHELRTPISNLMTETQVALSRARDTEAYRDVLASNAEEFDRLARIISDMLFLAKADHGLMLPSREPISLDCEVRKLFDFYDALAEDSQVGLELSGSGRILGDRLMLRRALSNLLSNALRCTPAGGCVNISVFADSAACSVVVENPGETIEPAQLPHLFDRFFRADKARVHQDSEGNGLGLAITKAIVTAHGGFVSASSCDGITRFTLTFPRSSSMRQVLPKLPSQD